MILLLILMKKLTLILLMRKKIAFSVTEFISSFFPKFDSENVIDTWYDIWQSNDNSKYFGYSKKEILDLWEEIRIDASTKGTQLHNDIENYVKNNDESLTKEFLQYLDFEKHYCDFNILESECIVYNEELDICGTIDRISEFEGEYYLFDWKRVKEIRETSDEECFRPIDYLANSNYWKYSLQLNFYKYILEKNYNINISGMYLVQLHPDIENFNVVKVGNLQKEIQMMIDFKR